AASRSSLRRRPDGSSRAAPRGPRRAAGGSIRRWSASRWPLSVPRPVRLALLEEGLDTLDGVVGRELDRELRLEELQCVLEAHVLLPEHRVLAEPHDDRRLGGELAGPVAHRRLELRVRDHAVDDPGLTRLL